MRFLFFRRLRSLEQCRPGTLPTSLALIDKSAGTELVVAHSKIVPVPYSSDACFVESGESCSGFSYFL